MEDNPHSFYKITHELCSTYLMYRHRFPQDIFEYRLEILERENRGMSSVYSRDTCQGYKAISEEDKTFISK